MDKINKIGEKNISNEGYEMKIIEYRNNKDMIVEFQDEYKANVKTTYQHFKNGKVKNPFRPDVYNIGYLGQGKYKSIGKDGKKTKAYKYWHHMLERCYDPYRLNKYPTYIDCYVCDEWLCFQNFAEWFYQNYYEIENERMHLDKDILVKGNKIYSPETCVFVPNRINTLFVKQQRKRGEYPIGVSPHKRADVLQASCNISEKQEYLGRFSLNKPFQAFTCYKNYKENYIKKVADEYKNLIPSELYEALYKWEVEIND